MNLLVFFFYLFIYIKKKNKNNKKIGDQFTNWIFAKKIVGLQVDNPSYSFLNHELYILHYVTQTSAWVMGHKGNTEIYIFFKVIFCCFGFSLKNITIQICIKKKKKEERIISNAVISELLNFLRCGVDRCTQITFYYLNKSGD